MSNPPDTNQASELFELCKEVYERLEWQIDDATWIVGDENGDLFILTKEVEAQGYYDYYAPLYTTDYLLEKLPNYIYLQQSADGKSWRASQLQPTELRTAENAYQSINTSADTPLLAILKLTLKLHEEGLL